MKISSNNIRKEIGKSILADGMNPIIDLEKSHGSWLVDARDGKQYLDLFSMFASMPVGYNHPYMIENKDRLLSSAINKPTNSDVYSEEMAIFTATMKKIAQPDYLPYSFFVEGGALGVENALKAAFDWKVRKNLSKGNGEKGSKILHYRDCFHGRTGYTMSLTHSPDKRKTMYYPKFDWPRIDNPSISFPLSNDKLVEIEKKERDSIDQIKNALMKNPNDIAGLIIEPIQGEGGDNHFRDEYFAKLRELANENEFLLIYDEVQTGVGITGKMWAHQNHEFDSLPDIIAFGKKTQVCGVFAGQIFDEVEGNVFQESSRINSTWGGSLVDMVRFTMYLEIIQNENLIDMARQNGLLLQEKLLSLESSLSGLVSNSRNKGLFGAFDLPSTDLRDKAIKHIEAEGVLMLGSGTKTVRFRPHLNISPKEIDQGFEMIQNALKNLS